MALKFVYSYSSTMKNFMDLKYQVSACRIMWPVIKIQQKHKNMQCMRIQSKFNILKDKWNRIPSQVNHDVDKYIVWK